MRPSILTSAVVAALLPALSLSATASAQLPVASVAARAKGKSKPKPAARRRARAPARRRARAPARRRASAPPEQRIPRDPPKRGVTYSVSGTITVNSVIKTRCSGLGDKGWITDTVTTVMEHSFRGSGSPGGKGSLKTTLRRRVVQDKQVVDVEYVKPLHIEGQWSSSSGGGATFGDVVFLSRGQLFVDLQPAIGERRRSHTVRPAPGASAPVRFGGAPVREETDDPGIGCIESSITTDVSGTLNVTNES